MIGSVLDPREGGSEGPKLLHFVSFREKSLWKSPDLTPPPANQSEPLASPSNAIFTLERLADRWVEAVEPELWTARAENSSQGSIRQSPE